MRLLQDLATENKKVGVAFLCNKYGADNEELCKILHAISVYCNKFIFRINSNFHAKNAQIRVINYWLCHKHIRKITYCL